MNTIFWASDSTVQYNDITTYPQTGIGQVFNLYVKPQVRIANYAKNGTSTKSFMDQGRLERISSEIGKEDFLFIQFGHNDEKIEDPLRYTDPEGTYTANLKIYIQVARQTGAYPLLITPLSRREFDNGVLTPGKHWPYVDAMKKVAISERVPLIDLHQRSRELQIAAGDEGSRKWHMYFDAGVYENYPEGKKDNTHLRYEGAVKYAGLIAEGLKDLGGVYGELLL